MTQPRNFGFDEEIEMLKDSARRFFDEKQPLVQLRPHLKGNEDPHRGTPHAGWYDAATWRAMQDLGWHLLAVPESAGGLGMGLVAAAAIQEEIGRAACPTPLTSTLLTTFVLREANAAAQLAQIAEGKAMALAIWDEDGSLEADSTGVEADGQTLNGTSWFVQDARKVDGFVVAAHRRPGWVCTTCRARRRRSATTGSSISPATRGGSCCETVRPSWSPPRVMAPPCWRAHCLRC
jgi:alkylation response protein AidB-like acyl-CoA dehydrogenase